ncbi:DUF423 domain-containing protein [Pedobacter faecalis]|uniref:DUF423 domain-containing protein n=1 Tax=Pedobacter faecalis TaxID=3041495 RepID=UPI00254E5C5C|nr:DUF423 domain-containing protein [Pedobacter sp. ELA7]
MNKQILVAASLLGALSVVLGAFGAHGLRSLISEAELATWAKAVEYQFYHTLVLLFLSKSGNRSTLVRWCYRCFVSGIVLFSGSLYLLATRSATGFAFASYLGPVTPIGGVLLIVGWLMLFLSALKTSADA